MKVFPIRLPHMMASGFIYAGLANLCLAPTPASAAFETLHFPAEPLPFSCDQIKFDRMDRREEVAKAIRDMVHRQIKLSHACSPDAQTSATIELLNVHTTSTVASDGTAHGSADILYRVRHPSGKILLNDRIHTENTVHILQALHLQQTGKRAARHSAFTANISQMLFRLAQTVDEAPYSGGTATALPQVELAHPLETEGRSHDFAKRIAEALALTAPRTVTPDYVYRLNGLKIRQLPGSKPDTVAAKVQLHMTLRTVKGQTIWNGNSEGTAEIMRNTAKLAGLNPLDTAIAEAAQTAIRKAAPRIVDTSAETSRSYELTKGISLPYSLTTISRNPNDTDAGLVATLQNWARGNSNFAQVWQGNTQIAIRVEALHAAITPSPKGGIAEVAGTYSVSRPGGDPIFITRRDSKVAFKQGASAQATNEAAEIALRFGLMESWTSLLKQLQNTPSL